MVRRAEREVAGLASESAPGPPYYRPVLSSSAAGRNPIWLEVTDADRAAFGRRPRSGSWWAGTLACTAPN
jgi:hypothetical protein